MTKIQLVGGVCALVDDRDAVFLSRWTWHLSNNGYAVSCSTKGRDSKERLMHRVVMERRIGKFPLIDHANRNTLDNRLSNLRAATSSENGGNRIERGKGNTSGFKGVHKTKSGRWQAKIGAERRYIGNFETPEDAAAAYDQAARERYGPFARTNLSVDLPK
jgi:hypothetical protein